MGASIEGGFNYSSDQPARRELVEETSRSRISSDQNPGTGKGWTCVVVSARGNTELEQLDDAGRDWFATGPRGDAMGGLREVLTGASDEEVEEAWIAAVSDAIERELGSARRSALLVKRVTGTWFHATFAENRASILHHGLDYRRMSGPGIAGSMGAEAAGVFLVGDLEGAGFFARMGRRGPVDIWAVELVDAWLVGDPGAGGGGDESWMICPEPIGSGQLTLVEKDITDSVWSS